MTEAQARHLLRTGLSPLPREERERLLAEEWKPTQCGWTAFVPRTGTTYHLDRYRFDARLLFIARRRGDEGLGGVWVEPALPQPPKPNRPAQLSLLEGLLA